jgi:WD40 repeat protein
LYFVLCSFNINEAHHKTFNFFPPCTKQTTMLEGEGGTRDNPITSSKIGVNFFRKYYSYQNQTYRIEYWDCPGASRYVSLARHFSAGAAAALILFDKNNRASFESVSNTWLRALESSCTSVIPILVGTTTGYGSPKKGKTNVGGIMGLDDEYSEQFGFGKSHVGSRTDDFDVSRDTPVSDDEARQFAKRYGLEYVNADPLARGEPDFATPSGVFEFVFSSIIGSLPRLAEPSLLLQRGVKLGSLLLGDRKYQQKLYSSSNRTRAKLPVTSRKGAKKSSKKDNVEKQRQEPKVRKTNSIIGDEHLDQEGEVPDRTDRQIREMGKDIPKLPTGSGRVDGYLVKSKSQVVTHYMQSKSWHSTARRSRPSAASDRSREPIGHSLSLEYVHGFRGQDARNNVNYAQDGTIVYIAAALAIAVDPKSGRQRYMSEHTDDIISIALSHVTKKRGAHSIVATGEIGRTPKIIVWESDSMRVINTLKGAHQRGVVQLSFSPDGKNLASIGLDDQNSLAIHDWRSGAVLVRVRTGGAKIFGMAFQPGPKANPMDDSRLVTCGAKHLTFWKRSGKTQISSRNGRFGAALAGELSFVDICFDSVGRTIAASNLGHLCVWPPKDNNTAMLPLGNGSIANAHEGPINSVEPVPGGEKIVSGGVDGKIKVWLCPSNIDRKIELLKTFDTFAKQARISSIQSLSVSVNKARALVGTRGGDIIEVKLSDGSLIKDKPLMTGHNKGELWGLAAHPLDATLFATGGDDKTVRMWSIKRKTCVAVTESGALPDMCRALAFTPRKGDFLACGLGGRLSGRKVGDHGKHAGKLIVLDSKTLKVQSSFKVAKEMISDVCFTPDGNTLAVASHDNIIYLLAYRGPTDLQPKSRCRGHSSFVTNICINDSGRWMMSNDGAGEILFWDVQTGDHETRIDKVKNARWFPNTCPLSWSSQGIWPKDGDLTDVNACMQRGVGKSGMEGPSGYGLLVTADDFGKVKLFNSPSLSWCAPHMVHRGHSSHVTNVCFNSDGSRVISIGGNDRCAFVWRVVQANDGADGGSFGHATKN